MTLTRSLPTQHASGLPLIDERRITVGLFARNADGTVRVGVLPAHNNPIVTGRASMGYDVAAFNAVTSRTSAGAEEIANDASGTVTTTAAPGSNSRIDVVWVRSQFVVLGDANNDVVFGVTQGTAAVSPVKPAIPAGALELATATIPSTATTTLSSGVVITQTHQYTAAAGGVVQFRNATDRDAFVAAEGTLGEIVGTGGIQVRLSGAWVYVGGAMPKGVAKRTVTGVSIPPGAYTNLSSNSYWSVSQTQGGMTYSNGWVVPVAGVYEVSWSLYSTGTTPFLAGVAKNIGGGSPTGDTLIAGQVCPYSVVAMGGGSADLVLAAGDVLTLWGYSAPGTSAPITSNSGPTFSIKYVGPVV